MKQYNCPDCQRTDSCDGCPRILRLPTNQIDQTKPIFDNTLITQTSYSNNACENCSNNPKNGGTGICHCILGTSIVY